MRDALSDETWALVRGTTYSELLFALFVDALRTHEPMEALAATFAQVAALAPDRRALLSVVATNGERVLATTHALAGRAPSLYRARRDDRVHVASEPTDDDGWEPLTPGVIFELRVGGGRELRL